MDIRTLFLANALGDACMLLILTLYLGKRKTYPGFRLWVAATAANLAASLGLGLRDIMPDWASIVLGLGAYPLSVNWRLAALRAYLGLGTTSSAWYAFPAMSLVVGLGLAYTVGAPHWRSMIASLATAIPGSYLCFLLYRHPPKDEAPFRQIMAAMLGALLLVLMIRAVSALDDPGFHLLNYSPINLVFLLALMATHIMMNVFFLVLNSQRLESELTEAQAQVKTLGGLVPICANCKKIRDDHGFWQKIEEYLEQNSGTRFTHGICPQCMRELYPEYVDAVGELKGRGK